MVIIFRNPQIVNEIKVKPQNFNFNFQNFKVDPTRNSFQLLKLIGHSIILKET